jgi:GNAT superfamily N-acetyltransferase
MLTLVEVNSEEDYALAVSPFKEYAAQLTVDLAFQNFNEELFNIRKQYGRPDGIIVLAYARPNQLCGCFAIRKLEKEVCELKRMYLRKEYRGQGYGKKLLEFAQQQGRKLGYQKMRLDTLPEMQQAIALYLQMGFNDIPAYRYNPVPGTRYLEVKLG